MHARVSGKGVSSHPEVSDVADVLAVDGVDNVHVEISATLPQTLLMPCFALFPGDPDGERVHLHR